MKINYNNRIFTSVSNSGSGEVNEETRFYYKHVENVLWSTYSGGAIKFGTLTGLVNDDGSRKFEDYKDFIVNWEKEPGIGFLSGWRLDADGNETHLRGMPNPKQWGRYAENGAFFEMPLP